LIGRDGGRGASDKLSARQAPCGTLVNRRHLITDTTPANPRNNQKAPSLAPS